MYSLGINAILLLNMPRYTYFEALHRLEGSQDIDGKVLSLDEAKNVSNLPKHAVISTSNKPNFLIDRTYIFFIEKGDGEIDIFYYDFKEDLFNRLGTN